jgi:dTDP-glucose 4,6-dehydratase
VTRCSNNYGPYQYPEKQLPLFITNALADRQLPVYGDGRNTRDWIHVDDHCSALVTILDAPAEQVVGEVFNIGSDEEHSILQNAATVLATLGKPESMIAFVPDRLGHVRRHAVNSAKLRAQLGWAPRVTFEDGIARAIAWYRDNTPWLDNLLARQDAFLDKALTLATSES